MTDARRIRRRACLKLELLDVVTGLVIVQCAKAWFIDRMVLLFEDMKTRNPEYAAWEY